MQEPERDEKNQNKCPRCGRIVGCDETGETRECDCITTYSVSLCLSIEAENENKAIEQFYIKMNECAFDRDSIDIEKE